MVTIGFSSIDLPDHRKTLKPAKTEKSAKTGKIHVLILTNRTTIIYGLIEWLT